MVEPTAPPTAPAPAPTTAPGGPATRKPPVPPRPAPARTAQPPTATEATIANTNFMGVSPEREDYRPQPLKVGESRRARRLALNVLPRNWKAGACRRNTYAPHLCIRCGQRRTLQMRSTPILRIGAVERNRTSTGYAHSALNAARLPIPPRPHGNSQGSYPGIWL